MPGRPAWPCLGREISGNGAGRRDHAKFHEDVLIPVIWSSILQAPHLGLGSETRQVSHDRRDTRNHAGEVNAWMARAQQGCGESLGKLMLACRDYLLLVAENEMPGDLRRKSARRIWYRRRSWKRSAISDVLTDATRRNC